MITRFEKIKIFFNTDFGESVVAVFSGGVPATIVSYSIESSILKICLTALVGLVGGVAGLLGKDIYNWIKSKIVK